MKRILGALLLLATACGAPQADLDRASRAQQAATTCPSATVAGVDVSDGNGTIDWGQAHGAGIGFAYMKATQGDSFTASSFGSNWTNSRANGVVRGAYHFFDPTVDGVAQANYFLGVMGALSPGDLPPALDVECPDGDPNCLGFSNNTWPSASTIHQRIVDWLTTVEAATGRKPVIYTFPSYFSSNGITDSDLAGYPLWIADLSSTTCFSPPADWTSAVIWQWNWNGTVAGISGSVDEDRFIGDLSALQAFAAGAPPRLHRARTVDLDGDGRADLCGRGPSGITCWLAGNGGFTTRIDGPALADDAGWSDPAYYETLQFGDVTGDGRADLCARGASGVQCWPSNGAGFDAPISGPAWTDADGWNQDRYGTTIQLADVNGDGKADVCARGSAGILCYLSNGAGFPTSITGPAMSDANDWGSPKYFSTIRFPDIDGDGKADVCGRASAGVFCWRSNGAGFDSTMLDGPTWSDASGWDQPRYYATIQFADVNGDGKEDVCGRGPNGVECWLSNGSGFPTQFTGPAWSDANGWDALAYDATIQFADINGDGKADVCGRSVTGIECWLSDGNSFATQVTGPGLADSAGWSAIPYYWTLELADVTGDGRADVCARAAAGYACWSSQGSGFGAQVSSSQFSDADGFGVLPYYPTVELVGGIPAASTSTSGSSGTGGSSSTSSTGTSGSTSSGSSTGTSSSGASGGASGSTSGGSAASKGGCGCASGDPALSLGALALLIAVRARRRRS